MPPRVGVVAAALLAAAACAAVPGGARGQALSVVPVPCSQAASYDGHQWNVTHDAQQEITLVSPAAGAGRPFCLDIDNYGTTAGSIVWAYPCTRSTDPAHENERWNFTDGLVRSTFPGAQKANLCLGQNSVFATLEPCDASSNVHWEYTSDMLLQLTDPTDPSATPTCLAAVNNTVSGCETGGIGVGKPYCDLSLSFDDRVDNLMSFLNDAEIIAMLGNQNAGLPLVGLPQNKFAECLHGVLSGCGPASGPNSTGCPTSFPSALTTSSAFNISLIRDMADVISTEARALNNNGVTGLTFWAPDINLFRDPRWGRGQEVPGEDPFFTSEYAREFISHLQGTSDERYFRIISTPKHFSSYGMENSCWGGQCFRRTNFNAIVNARDQAEYYFPAFRSAVEEGRAYSMMCSYNAVNGIPSCANSHIQNDIFRDQWGFEGFIVTDCGAISDFLPNQHNYTQTDEEAVAAAMAGGTDVNCGSMYQAYLGQALQQNLTSSAAVRQAGRRLLLAMFKLGYMDPASLNPYSTLGPLNVDTADHRALALDAGHQSMVLLKNDKGILPLSTSLKNIALVGPHANSTQDLLSNYHGTNTLVNTHSAFQVMSQRFGGGVTYNMGCDVNSTDTSGIAAAVAAAKAADVAIVFVGLNQDIEREGHDRPNLELPGVQPQLVQAVIAAQPNTVVVLVHGGPIASEWIKDNAPAILDAHYPGELGGDAMTDTLFGDYNPSGRLTTTVYPAAFINRSVFNMDMQDDGGITYQYYDGKYGAPLFEFGQGLSYTTFTYTPVNETEMEVASGAFAHREWSARQSQDPAFYVKVTNTGTVAGATSVLGFVNTTLAAPTAGPNQKLFAFAKTFLQPGESDVVQLTAPGKVWCSFDEAGKMCTLHPGQYSVSLGGVAFKEGVVHSVQVTGAAKRIL